MVHIITHNDLDGYSAGYVALQHFGEQNCDIEHFNYDKEPVIEGYKEGDTVIITDYSLTNDQYRQILAKIGEQGTLIWCDHHITAIDRYNEEPDLCIQGLRSTKYCGAVLTYLYLNFSMDTEDVENFSYDQIMVRIPQYLRYVDAWDTWKLDVPYRQDAEYLNIAVGSRLSIPLIGEVKDCLKDYIDIGKYYTEFRDDWAKQFRDKYMFDMELPGTLFGYDDNVRMAVLNIGCANSTYFGENIDTYDVCMTLCFNGKNFVCSFYSNKSYIDCSKAAKHFGGGGHKGAAGCTLADSKQLFDFISKGEM